jgi:serine phosphatase RsbU (regulator of sigma subunit)
MPDLFSELRQDLTRLGVGLVLVALVGAVSLVAAGGDVMVPAGLAILVPLTLALVAGPAATALLVVVTLWIVLLIYIAVPSDNPLPRYLIVAGVGVLAVAASAVRRRREQSLLAQSVELALVRDHEMVARISRRMMEAAPLLSAAADVPGVAANATRIGRDLFEAAACSYWQVEGDECVLIARTPAGGWALGTRLPTRDMAVEDGRSRTAYARRDDLPDGHPRRAAMQRAGAVTGTSTAIRVDGRTVAFLAMSWLEDDQPSSSAWFDLLDRFGDQVALAKTVVRRRAAQDQAQRLGRRLQHALLPNLGIDAGPVLVRTLYRPGTRDLLLGGDFLDVTYRRDSDGLVAFLLGDVSGHGPEQAAAASSLRSAWSAMAMLPDLGIDDWAAGMQHVLGENDPDQTMFVTVVMGTLDPGERRLRYTTAGHPPPLLLCGDEIVRGEESGPPLGVLPDAKLVEFELDARDCHGVLMVTDGIFEGFTAPGDRRRIGWDDFVELVRTGEDCTGEEYLERLADSMAVRNGGPLQDDVAALLMLWADREQLV